LRSHGSCSGPVKPLAHSPVDFSRGFSLDCQLPEDYGFIMSPAPEKSVFLVIDEHPHEADTFLAEDAEDLRAIENAQPEEMEFVPWEKIKAELGL